MSILVLYTYLSSAIAIYGWSMSNSRGMGRMLGMAFFASFIAYTLLYFLTPNNGLLKLPIFLFSVFILAISSFIIQRSKDNKFVAILIALAFVFGIKSYLGNFMFSQSLGTNEAKVDTELELLVEMKEKRDIASLDDIKHTYDLDIARAFYPKSPESTELDDVFSINVPSDHEKDLDNIIKAIKDIKGVEWIETNDVYSTEVPSSDISINKVKSFVNDPMASRQWSLKATSVSQLHNVLSKYGKPKKKATIVILDSGVDAKHEDLRDNYNSLNSKYDKDTNGHGTHCAGIAAAVSNNNKGIASPVPSSEWVQVTGIKTHNVLGLITQKRATDGIIEAADAGADVISMSFGARAVLQSEKLFQDAVDYAISKGVILVAAAGNSSRNAIEYSPANLANVITVSSVNQNQERSFFSNTLEDVTYGIAAPGEQILSTVPGSKYETKSGTSMATPYVAGIIGIMKALRPDIDTEDAYHLIYQTGIVIDESRKTGRLIQPARAIQSMSAVAMSK